jgi:hypothetical protein
MARVSPAIGRLATPVHRIYGGRRVNVFGCGNASVELPSCARHQRTAVNRQLEVHTRAMATETQMSSSLTGNPLVISDDKVCFEAMY